MFPLMAHRMSSSDGRGFSSRRCFATSIMPGVQKPHCSPCSSLNPSWIGSRPSAPIMPSTVVIARPSACTPNTVHDFTGVPSSSTVHAPHEVVSHPMCVPVYPRVSRMTWTRSWRGSTSVVWSAPFSLTLISMAVLAPPLQAAGRLEGPGQAATDEDLHDVPLVLGGAADVGDGIARRGREPAGFGEGLVGGLRAGQALFGLGGLDVLGADGGERDPRPADRAVRQLEVHADGDRGEVADLAFHLQVCPARTAPRRGHPDLGQDLVGLERGRERVLE